jgi:hypothetical protein
MTEAYQAALEHLRAAREEHDDCSFIEQLEEDVLRARRAMEIAWLEDSCA